MDEIELDNIDTRLKTTTGTNTNPFSQVGIINKETKKKPYDVKIKNNNPNEPKVNINMKYSDKQKYRRYKTKTEPKLFSKIMIDEEDDIVNTIKKAFGMENKKNTNMTNVETSGVPYYEEPKPVEGEEPNIVEMVRETAPAQEEELPAAPAAARRGRTQEPSGMITRAKSVPRKASSIATEVTSEIVQPEPISPGKLLAMNALKSMEENNKRREIAQAEAEERAKKEKERIFNLSMMTMAAREENDAAIRARLAEVDERERKRLDERERKDNELIAKNPTERTKEENERVKRVLYMRNEYEKELKKYVGLTEKERKALDYQFKLTGYVPGIDTFGRTPKDRENIPFWIDRR
jgi:gamma-glutamylcyclotransferase (GGCT)/AIG2-like uncharacterized protein YtfP